MFGFWKFVEIGRYIEIGVMKQVENPLLHRFQSDNHSTGVFFRPLVRTTFSPRWARLTKSESWVFASNIVASAITFSPTC